MPKKTKLPRVLERHKYRDLITVPELIKRLQDNALGVLNPPLDQNKIRSIEILLKKAMPDLSAVEMAGDDQGGPIQITWGRRR